MQTSEQLDLFVTYFFKAKEDFNPLKKSGTNTFFKGKDGKGTAYSTLEDALDTCSHALGKYGFILFQGTHKSLEGELLLVTKIIHKSGQFISTECPLILAKQDMQGLGSALTYARRYSLLGLLTISDLDDDGNGASHEETLPKQKPQPKGPLPKPITNAPPSALIMATTVQKNIIWKKALELMGNDKEAKAYLQRVSSELGKKSSSDFTFDDADKVMKIIGEAIAAKIPPEPGSFDDYPEELMK